MQNVNEVILTNEEIRRYSRHLLMPEVGLTGQKKLKAASVLIIGAGGLGSPAALYLAAAGVGRIGLVDFDVVDESNLQRQILHGTSWVGKPKLASAKARLLDLNPDITVETHETVLTSANALEILKDYDIIIDGTDNFPTRYLVNDACVFLGKHPGLRQHLPVRGAGHRLRRPGGALLSLPLPGAPAARPGALLRRGRGLRRAAPG